MSEDDLSGQRDAQNRRKLQENLERLKRDEPKAEAPSPDRPPRRENASRARQNWEAWKRHHGRRIHNLAAEKPPEPHADYKALGLPPGASRDDIRKAYYRLAKKHHPDAGGNPEQFQMLLESYERLSGDSGQANSR